MHTVPQCPIASRGQTTTLIRLGTGRATGELPLIQEAAVLVVSCEGIHASQELRDGALGAVETTADLRTTRSVSGSSTSACASQTVFLAPDLVGAYF